MDNNQWQNLLDQMNSSGNFYRLKEGKTRLRLIAPQERVDQKPVIFFEEVQSTFRGRTKTKYMILCLVLEGKGAKPEMATTVTPVIVTKTVIKGILGLLAEGYDLFDPTEGYGFSINRTGSGLETDYSVLASRKPVPLDADSIVLPQKTITELAADYMAWANRPRGEGEEEPSDEEGDSPSRGRKTQTREDW